MPCSLVTATFLTCSDDLHTKIVGVRYYRGYASVGERVLLRREPNNPYDKNAIRVDNVMGQQIGHIGRHMAARLAPYMVKRFQAPICIHCTKPK